MRITVGSEIYNKPVALEKTKSQYTQLIQSCHWTHFITATFRGMPHPEECHKRFVRAFRIADQRNAAYVRVLEYQRRGAVHYHAMACLYPYPSYKPGALLRALRRCCGISAIDLIFSNEGVATYLTKYVLKAVGSEFCQIDFSPRLRRLPTSAAKMKYFELLQRGGAAGIMRLF